MISSLVLPGTVSATTQRNSHMAHGKLSIDGCASKEPPLSPPAFEEVLSCVDPNGVITWLKLVEKPHVDSF